MRMTIDLPDFPLDHLCLSGNPAATALIIRDNHYSYQMLSNNVGRLAFFLRASGLGDGDRVATWMSKGLIACLMPLAAARAGCIHVPINPLLKAPQAVHILHDSGARMLIANKARLAALDDAAAAHGPPATLLLDEGDILSFLDQYEAGGAAQSDFLPPLDRDYDPHRLAAILYTSGSTGRPKGVMLSHRNLVLGAVAVARYLKLAADDVTLALLPLSFDYGQNQLLSSWYSGACVVPLDYLTPRDVVKCCDRYQVTTLAAVPPLWVQLVEQDWPDSATAMLRRLTNSGGALTPTLVRQLRHIFSSKTDIYAMYGLTEAFRSTYLDPSLIDDHPTSMGKAIPFAEIMVVRPDGSAAEPGEEGELVHAGPLVAQGYWRDTERSEQRFKPAPLHSHHGGTAVYSGDTVRQDADGLLYFVGRGDAMIKSSGNRISPTEIEEAAVQSGAVVEACAVGRPDERLGAAIILFVRAGGTLRHSDAKEAMLRGYLKNMLPNFMQPTEIIWLTQIPVNANGKIDRGRLENITWLSELPKNMGGMFRSTQTDHSVAALFTPSIVR